MLDFGLPPQWELAVNLIFLAVTGYIAITAIQFKDKDGQTDWVRLLFGCIAAVFFMLVLLQDVLQVAKFG
jgi:hypothetical protein